MFEVEWRPEAQNDLTEAWIAADGPGRQAITQAVQRIDRSLERNPLDTGEGRAGNDRIHFERPLVVLFEVLEAQQQVKVLRMWTTGSRR